jgi:hypothetical protein
MYQHYQSLISDAILPGYGPYGKDAGRFVWQNQTNRPIFQAFADGQVLYADALYSVERPNPLNPPPTPPGGTGGDGPGGTQILPDGTYPLPDGSAYLPPPVATISVGTPTVTFEP